ncbi:dTTP/UTP pyrophosphatase [Coccinella septempunctata]|uniref:dTTP/UTP pyrophosphatase n=1 Tax=Coccinella septempunctata TaxID=41139 RepID=UPI001D0862CB|nr:dTTP/UTP pyrophosphatase [Coccinella septempunctata]
MLEPLVGKLKPMRIVLASGSKQREVLLRSTGLDFEIYPSSFAENLNPDDYTFKYFVEATAQRKTENVFEVMKYDEKRPDLIIGADTMVTFCGKMYGKPKDNMEARRMIKDLTQSDKPHEVYTGVAIWYKGEIHTFSEMTRVHMTNLTDEEIENYILTKEPMGKAGGYGIQGLAATFVERIEGDVNNVIGLPLCRLVKELKQIVKL